MREIAQLRAVDLIVHGKLQNHCSES